MTDQILDSIDQTLLGPLKEILQIWEYVGYTEQEKSSRLLDINQRLKSTIQDVVKTENNSLIKLESELEEYKRKSTELSNALEIPVYIPPRTLSVYESIQNLKAKFNELESIKEERVSLLNKYIENVNKYTRLLSKNNADYDSSIQSILTSPQKDVSDKLPTKRLMDQLQELDSSLEREYKPLYEQYEHLCNTIGKIAKDFGYRPIDDFEAKVLAQQGVKNVEIERPSTPGIVRSNNIVNNCLSDKNGSINGPYNLVFDDDDMPILNEDLIDFLKSWQLRLVKEKARIMGICEEMRTHIKRVWKRLSIDAAHQEATLKKCHQNNQNSLDILREEMNSLDQLKWEKLPVYLEGIKHEYLELVDLCCVERDLNFDQTKDDPESIVCRIEREIDRLRMLYDDNHEIFDTLAAYRKLWTDLYDVERRMKDPSILSNRGGILLKTEKEKKTIIRDLKTAEGTILEKISQNKSNPSFFQGLNFSEYVAKRQREYEVMLKESKGTRRTSSAVSRNGPPGAPS